MTTTQNWLSSKDHGEFALTLVFDGIDLIYTTTDETAAMLTAHGGDWTVCKSGLELPGGAIEQTLTLFKPSIEITTLDLFIVDHDDTMLQTMLSQPANNPETFLLNNAEPTDTEFLVNDASAFAASGHIHAGLERIAYSSTTVGGIDEDVISGLTRGKNAIFGTTSSPNAYARYQRVNRRAYGSRTQGSRITQNPTTWFNRTVALFLHHKENGVWSTRADSRLVWAGRVKNWGEDGDGRIRLTTWSINELFKGDVFFDQYRGDLSYREFIRAEYSGFSYNDYDREEFVENNFLGVGTRKTWNEIIDVLQTAFDALFAASAITSHLSVALRDYDEGPRVTFMVERSPPPVQAAGNTITLGLHPRIWSILGFGYFKESTTIPLSVGRVRKLSFDPFDTFSPGGAPITQSNTFALIASEAPIAQWDYSNAVRGNTISVFRASGSFVPQSSIPAEYSAGDPQGFLLVQDNLFAVKQTVSGPPLDVFEITANNESSGRGKVTSRLGEGNITPEVKQVWLERGELGKLLLQLAVSTGESGYNDSTYDVYQYGQGLAVPAQLIDFNSFFELDQSYELRLDGPRPFAELLAEALAVINRYPITREGKLELTPAGFDAPNVEGIIELTEDSKASANDRISMNYSEKGIINSIRVQYDDRLSTANSRNSGNSATGSPIDQPGGELNIADATSFSDYGSQKPLTIKVKGILEPESVIDYLLEPILTYFSKPFAILRSNYNATHESLLPGDIVKITDNRLVDPRSGSRGVAGLAAFVMQAGFNFAQGIGSYTAAFLPSHEASKYARLGPSGKLLPTSSRVYAGTSGNETWIEIGGLVQTGFYFASTFTFECWVKSSVPGNGGAFIVRGTASAGTKMYRWFIDKSNNFTLQLSQDGNNYNQVSVTYTLPLNTWVHLAVTCWIDGITNPVKFFVNGSQQGATQSMPWGVGSPFNSPNTDVVIGDIVDNTGLGIFLTAKMCEFRVWNIIRQPSEISADYQTIIDPTTSGLIAYLFPADVANNVDTDRTSNTNHFTDAGVVATTISFDRPFAVGYVAATPSIELLAHEFSSSSDPVDAASFANGDEIAIRELSPAPGVAPLVWSRVVSGIPVGNVITLNSALSSPAFDTSKRYIVEYDDILTVGLTQQDNAFIADDSTRSTGLSPRDARLWAAGNRQLGQRLHINIVDEEFIRTDHGVWGVTGEPVSTRKLNYYIQNVNNLLRYRTRNSVVNIPEFVAPLAITSVISEELIWGPLYVRLTSQSPADRNDTRPGLICRIGVGRTAGAGDVDLIFYSAPRRVLGAGRIGIALSHDTQARNVRLDGANSAAWYDFPLIRPAVVWDEDGRPGTWVYITASVDTGGTTGELHSVTITEESLG
jgi:hypothetical protein